MKQPVFYIFLFILFTGVSCDKDKKTRKRKTGTTPITTEGKNTFGCKIIWVVEVDLNNSNNFFLN